MRGTVYASSYLGVFLIPASEPAKRRKCRKETASKQRSTLVRPKPSSTSSPLPVERQTIAINEDMMMTTSTVGVSLEPQSELSDDLDTDGVCPLCFLRPCVASLPGEWLGRGQAAHTANSSIRRVMYGKYWKMISNLGGWANEHYMAKKQTETNGVHHMREIMPDCAVLKVRTLYPNPAGIPYLGHKWE